MFVFKSTPAELSLALFLLVVAVGAVWRPWRTMAALDSSMLTLVVAAAVFIPLLLTSHLNQGQRYMIPLYPIVIFAACDRLAARLENRAWTVSRRCRDAFLRARRGAVSRSLRTTSRMRIRFAGGPENGWRLMADSSLDWGQDLPGLRQLSECRRPRTGRDEILRHRASGSVRRPAQTNIEHLRRRPEEYGVLALSVTYLDGLHLSGRDPFKDFRRFEPAAQVGHSIMVYDLRRPEALAAFREALKAFHS